MPVNETEINDRIKKQIDNEIATQRQSINNGLKTQKNEFDGTINRNNSYLDEQIKSMNTQKVVTDDQTTALQNRRGGFYSGGLDYQLAENNRNTLSAQDGVRRDINDKNQGILGQYNTLASQAANQISTLEQQAPDRIRQLVNAELDKQRQLQMEEERFALEQQLKQLQLQQAQSAGSGGSGGGGGGGGRRSSRGSSGGSSSSTPAKVQSSVAQQYTAAKNGSQGSSLDKYYAAQSQALNNGRSVVQRKLEDIYPGTIKAPKDNQSLSPWERNKIIIDSFRR